jgi:hypothetical protein
MISDLRLKRAAPLSRRVTPFHRRWDWGRRLATSIISASHASVNDESEARRGRPGSGRPDDATANTLVSQDGRIRIRTLVYTVQAVYVHVLQSWERSGKRFGRVDGQLLLPALQRENRGYTVGPVMHNDTGGAP